MPEKSKNEGTKRKASPERPKTRDLVPIASPLNHDLRKIFQDIRNRDVANDVLKPLKHGVEKAVAVAAKVTCNHPNCSFSSTKENVVEHAKKCIHALVPCVWCNEEVPLDCIETHWQECDHKFDVTRRVPQVRLDSTESTRDEDDMEMDHPNDGGPDSASDDPDTEGIEAMRALVVDLRNSPPMGNHHGRAFRPPNGKSWQGL